MSIVKVTPAAAFYIIMSAGLNHGHSLWFNSLELDGEHVIMDLPAVGKLDCQQSDWSEARQEYVDREVILGVREVHLLHQLQGRLVNREAMEDGLAGMEGWEVEADQYYTRYLHRTATGRLRFRLVVSGWRRPTAATETFSIEVCAGDGKTVAAVTFKNGVWDPWYGAAPGMHGGSDEQPIAEWLANHNATQRPDRFWTLAELLFDGEGNWILPGQSLAEVEHWGVGAALRACLEGKAFDIADAHKASQKPEEPEAFDPWEDIE